MSELREIVTFRSRRFVPILPEACQVKPRIYGAELAYWLMEKLLRQGVVTGYPAAGEAGWLLSYATGTGASFQVLCANVDGSDGHWRLSLACRAGHAGEQAYHGAEAGAEVKALLNAIRFVLYRAVRREEISWCWVLP